jgi:hypothetical protein
MTRQVFQDHLLFEISIVSHIRKDIVSSLTLTSCEINKHVQMKLLRLKLEG